MRTIAHIKSNAVAYLALFLALGGTSAYAADRLTSSDIAKSAITSKHVKDGQVKTKDVRDGSLLAKDFAAGQIPAVMVRPPTDCRPQGRHRSAGSRGSARPGGPRRPRRSAGAAGSRGRSRSRRTPGPAGCPRPERRGDRSRRQLLQPGAVGGPGDGDLPERQDDDLRRRRDPLAVRRAQDGSRRESSERGERMDGDRTHLRGRDRGQPLRIRGLRAGLLAQLPRRADRRPAPPLGSAAFASAGISRGV